MTEQDALSADRSRSDDILDYLRHKNDAAQIVDVEEERIQVVIFRLNDTLFAIYGSDAKEVLEVEKITVVPGSPDFILGIVNVRGDVESVIDLSRFLHLPPERESEKLRIIIAQNGEVRSGIRVSAIEDVVDIPKSALGPAISTLSESMREHVAGETEYRGRSVTVLDVGRIFEKIAAE